jgi:hypothetical protein
MFPFLFDASRKEVMAKTLYLLILTTLVLAASAQAVDKENEARLDEVARSGAQVMPFDLEQTTHIFSKTEKGGLQQVVAKEGSNTEQIELIRTHLSDIARQFRQGDFSGPAKVHGDDMPGLEELRKARPGQIRIEYRGLANGAQIHYSTDDPRLVDAIHEWFDAQLRDHARHAVPGSIQHPTHSH